MLYLRYTLTLKILSIDTDYFYNYLNIDSIFIIVDNLIGFFYSFYSKLITIVYYVKCL